jgi:hypothetical protein
MTNAEERLHEKAISFFKELKGTRENKIEAIRRELESLRSVLASYRGQKK